MHIEIETGNKIPSLLFYEAIIIWILKIDE